MGFPKFLYKKGTGKQADGEGCFTAESALVKSEEDLAKLEGEWCESPAEAVAEAPKPKKGK